MLNPVSGELNSFSPYVTQAEEKLSSYDWHRQRICSPHVCKQDVSFISARMLEQFSPSESRSEAAVNNYVMANSAETKGGVKCFTCKSEDLSKMEQIVLQSIVQSTTLKNMMFCSRLFYSRHWNVLLPSFQTSFVGRRDWGRGLVWPGETPACSFAVSKVKSKLTHHFLSEFINKSSLSVQEKVYMVRR